MEFRAHCNHSVGMLTNMCEVGETSTYPLTQSQYVGSATLSLIAVRENTTYA